MKSKRSSGPLTVGMFAEGTARELQNRIEALDVEIVLAVHDVERRRHLFTERTRLERKLEAVQHLTKGN